MKSLLTIALAFSLSGALDAQSLTRVRLQHPEAQALAVSLEEDGFDVLEGSVQSNQLELIVSVEEEAELMAWGYTLETIAVGRPFYDIQAERHAAAIADDPLDMPPAGYLDLAGVIAQMQSVAAAYPSICEFVDLTDRYGLPLTSGARRMYAIHISDNVSVREDEPAFLLVSEAHARETNTPVVALNAIDELTMGYGSDPDITAIVDSNDLWIIPLHNPDGYNYVFTTNNNWRKNRTNFGNGIGVDLNRNYPFGWASACGGSTNVSSSTYRGPSPASEVESQAVIALSNEFRFARVYDFHSFGRETLWEYACLNYPTAGYLQAVAVYLSNQAGYGGSNRPPSANGEHYEWQLATFGSMSYLTEIGSSFQPSYASAVAEAQQLWPSIQAMLEFNPAATGNVTDACTGEPVDASITFGGLPFNNGETVGSGGPFGRFDVFLPFGTRSLTFSAPGYQSQTFMIDVTETTVNVLEVELLADINASTAVRNGTSVNPVCYSTLSPPTIGGTWMAEVDHSGHPGATFTAVVVYQTGATGPIISGGEVLVDLGSGKEFQSLLAATGTSDLHSSSIPNDPCFAGLTAASQAVILGGGYELCNAIDMTAGY